MNDFEELVDKYKGMKPTEIKEALKILLEKKNEYRMNTANAFITMFLGIAVFFIGFDFNRFITNNMNIDILIGTIILVIIIAILISVVIFVKSNPYTVNIQIFEDYLDAIKKLDSKESTPSEQKPVEKEQKNNNLLNKFLKL